MAEYKKDLRAFESARIWVSEIRRLLRALNSAQESGNREEIDEAVAAIKGSVIGVAVRSAWGNVSKEMQPSEYLITLTIGGPEVRLCGDLEVRFQPYSARLEYQDWFEPWKEYTNMTPEENKLLIDYANEIFGW